MNIHTTPCFPRELVASTAFLLSRLGITVKKQTLEELEAAGFTTYDYAVLALAADAKCKTQATIADALGLDRSQLVGMLDGLEQRGLIERRRDPTDRRRHTIMVTTDGRRQLSKLRALAKRIEDEFLAPLDADSRAQLHALLVEVARHHDPRFEEPAELIAAAS
jgi:DNA-binding MarR family transcriptional regulator